MRKICSITNQFWISMKYIHWVHLDVNLQYNLAKTIIFLVNIMFNCILEYNTKKFFARFSSFIIKNENIRICQVVICLKRHLGNQTTRWLILKVYAACPLSTYNATWKLISGNLRHNWRSTKHNSCFCFFEFWLCMIIILLATRLLQFRK